MGGYGAAITQYFDASGEWTLKQAHNDYLELFASGGLFGFTLGAWFIASFVRMAQERLRLADSFRLSASCGALAGLFGAAIHSFVDFGLHITANALIFTALVAIATAQIGSSEQRAGREAEGPAPARPHHP